MHLQPMLFLVFFLVCFVNIFADPSSSSSLHDILHKRPLDWSNTEVPVRQFAHMHHMKTGGTSINQYIRCAIDRLRSKGVNLDLRSVTECSIGMVEDCLRKLKEDDDECGLIGSTAMNFCTSLANVERFGWKDAHKVTILRHPVDRVWSMYRFRTEDCYNCMPLAEVYHRVENGTLDEACDGHCEGVCIVQLFNHMTANFLSASTADQVDLTGGIWKTNLTNKEILIDALHNLRTQFAIVGLTKQMNTTVDLISEVFPWLARKVKFSNDTCEINHWNRSPRNPCAMEQLPPQPDPKTRKLIEKYNNLDFKIFNAGLERFHKEKNALERKLQSRKI